MPVISCRFHSVMLKKVCVESCALFILRYKYLRTVCTNYEVVIYKLDDTCVIAKYDYTTTRAYKQLVATISETDDRRLSLIDDGVFSKRLVVAGEDLMLLYI